MKVESISQGGCIAVVIASYAPAQRRGRVPLRWRYRPVTNRVNYRHVKIMKMYTYLSRYLKLLCCEIHAAARARSPDTPGFPRRLRRDRAAAAGDAAAGCAPADSTAYCHIHRVAWMRGRLVPPAGEHGARACAAALTVANANNTSLTSCLRAEGSITLALKTLRTSCICI